MSLCLHILSHHQSSSSSTSTSATTTNLISILIGNDDLYNFLMKKINDTGFSNLFFRNPGEVQIAKIFDNNNNNNNNSSSFCKIFAFGYFPSPDINKKLFEV